jgi:2-polyprenyl-6-methoxyphenol hydroxylase-like FAD-dependent oxidoreductase
MKCIARGCLEPIIRSCVAKSTPNIEWVIGHAVSDLVVKDNIVTHVKYHPTMDKDQTSVKTLAVDALFDVSGRAGSIRRCLKDYEQPDYQSVDLGIQYTTLVVRPIVKKPDVGVYARIVLGSIEKGCPGQLYYLPGLADGTAHLLVVGRWKDQPEPSMEGFREFITRPCFPQEAPPMGMDSWDAFFDNLEVLSAPKIYKDCRVVRWRWDLLKRWPGNYVPLGDVCLGLNPIYGQGMSSAAMQATKLEEVLQKEPGTSTLFPAAISSLKWVWLNFFMTNVCGDYLAADKKEHNMPPANLVVRIVFFYLRMMMKRAHNPEVFTAFMRVIHMVASPIELFHPRILKAAYEGYMGIDC